MEYLDYEFLDAYVENGKLIRTWNIFSSQEEYEFFTKKVHNINGNSRILQILRHLEIRKIVGS